MGVNRNPERHHGRILAMLASASLLAGTFAPAHARADEPDPAAKAEPAIEVRIEGEKSPVGGRDSTAASTVLRADRLHLPGQSAADALAQVPGVQVARTGAASDLATASIRGASSAQTPIYLAGVRLNDDITGTADLSLVPLWMVQRVEVYRGSAPVDADRLGIGGAIFFEPLLPHGTRLGAGLGVGSFGEIAARASGSFGDEGASAMIALERRSARNDYSYVDGRSSEQERTRHNADSIAYDLWSIGRYQLRGGSITAITNGFVRDQGAPGISLRPASAARAHVQRWLGAITAAVPCSFRAGEAPGERCRVEVQTAAIIAHQEISDPLYELGLLSQHVASMGTRVSEQARLRYRWNDAFTLGVSASEELEHLDIDLQGRPPSIHARRAVSRATASATVDLTRALSLNGLAALEYHATQGFRRSTGVFEPTARLGARLELGHGVTLLANAGRYVRVPTLGELQGISSTIEGNPDLVPERSLSVDLGARLSTKVSGNSLFLELFGFSRFASDLITFRQSGINSVRPFNTRSARTLGLELTVGAQLFHRLRAELSLTATDPRNTSGEWGPTHTLLPYQARLIAAPYLEVYQEVIKALALDRAALGMRLNHRSGRVVSTEGFVMLAPQTTVDLELMLLFWRRRVSAQLKLANLLDARNADLLGFPLPGRSVHGFVEVWW